MVPIFNYRLYTVLVILLYLLFSTMISHIVFAALLIVIVGLSFKTRQIELKNTFSFIVSEQGVLEFTERVGSTISPYQITSASFYNGLFIVLKLKTQEGATSIVLFKDAITQLDYRLLARIIKQL